MTYRTITPDKLKTILTKHKEWLADNSKGRFVPAKSLGYRYWVSDEGEVASLFNPCGSLRTKPLILSPVKSRKGYLSIKARGKHLLVHRLVATEFIGDARGKVVHHINGKRWQNHVTNLKITDHSDNNSEGHKTRAAINAEMYGAFINQCAELFKETHP